MTIIDDLYSSSSLYIKTLFHDIFQYLSLPCSDVIRLMNKQAIPSEYLHDILN